MNQHTYKQAIQALFEGRATTLQKALIEDWLSQPSHKELYFQWLEEWEQQNPQLIVDVQQAYTKWIEEVDTENSNPYTSPLFLAQRPSFFWWVAASISLLLLASTYLMRDTIIYKYHETAYGELRTLTLSDGSRVILNANSTLKVPRFGFGTGSRKVFLTGEAEFSIQHLPNHERFIVQTPDQLEVQVLGTEFMVYSRAREVKSYSIKVRCNSVH
ncbi:MAG: FecR family protein [Spirosomataceae bacterium]